MSTRSSSHLSRFLLLFFLVLSTASCRHNGPVEPPPPDKETQLPKLFAKALTSREAFDAFSTQVAGERYTKFIIDLRSDELLFFDVNIYPMHVDFVMQEIYRTPPTYQAIVDYNRNYEADKPEFMLCYLVHHTELDVWTFAFWEGDAMSPDHVRHAYRKLQEKFYAADLVKFRPDSTMHEAVAQQLPDLPQITNDELYRSSTYHAFNPGTSTGKLRIVRDAGEAFTFKRDEIIIVTVPLPDLTVVSGIISEEFSTPLSHVALRARAWNIPHIGHQNAAETFAALEGQIVTLKATPESMTLEAATEEEIAAWKEALNQTREVLIPRADLEPRDMRTLIELTADDTPAYGAKSSNLGDIAETGEGAYHVPAGFGLPIVYYHEHITRHGIDAKIEAFLNDTSLADDPERRKASLAELRKAIQDAPIDDALLDAVMVETDALRLPIGAGVFVRSSTNAEDLPGFNGAGLYDTVPNVMPEREKLGHAIRKVWASVWNFRAYEERSFFGIDHRKVYGAVLIHRGVNATAAGVLITTNIFQPGADTRTYTINAKSGLGIRVVEGRKIPEQLLYDSGNRGIKVLSRSDEETMLVFDENGGVREVPNPMRGQPVLTDKRAHALGEAAQQISYIHGNDEQALDIEWLFEDDILHIVQVRPYVR